MDIPGNSTLSTKFSTLVHGISQHRFQQDVENVEGNCGKNSGIIWRILQDPNADYRIKTKNRSFYTAVFCGHQRSDIHRKERIIMKNCNFIS